MHVMRDVDPVVVRDDPLVQGENGLVGLDPPHLEVPELGHLAGQDGLPSHHNSHVVDKTNKLRLHVPPHTS